MSQAPDDDDLDDDELDDDEDDDDLDDEDEEGDDADLEAPPVRARGADNEGIFNDKRSIFASRGRADERVNHRNPGPISRKVESDEVYDVVPSKDDDADVIDAADPQDDAMDAPPQPASTNLPVKAAPSPKSKQLVAKYDKDGNPHVAWFHDGEQQGKFKPPNRAEAELLMKKGKITEGGVGVVDEPSGIPWKKVAIGVGVVGAIGFGIWWVYKKNKADADTDVDEVDG